jgi:dGTPase
MMDWNTLLSPYRLGSKHRETLSNAVARSNFQRDYDRLIFSAPFRRLQDKTQVFPLPGSIFVHNRLTHSLEVASIGRSLGDMASRELQKNNSITNPLIYELGAVVSAACLAHDIGNPPFGHSGEQAISHFFTEGKGIEFKDRISEAEWNDLIHFEGNANAFRLLAHPFNGRRTGGFSLTYTTLASLVKYPWPSTSMGKKKKYGFFKSEESTYDEVANVLNIPLLDTEKKIYARHPLVYLVEAADDIAYQLMDLEDALKLGILDLKTVEELFMNFFDVGEDTRFYEIKSSVYEEVSDVNERIAFLRATVISKLINQVLKVFLENQSQILEGNFEGNLVKHLPEQSLVAFKKVSAISLDKIYRQPDVIAIELSGYHVLDSLLDAFTTAVLNPATDYNSKLISIMPDQFKPQSVLPNEQIRSVLDFVSSMTDLYAVKLHRMIKGI